MNDLKTFPFSIVMSGQKFEPLFASYLQNGDKYPEISDLNFWMILYLGPLFCKYEANRGSKFAHTNQNYYSPNALAVSFNFTTL